MGGELLHVGRKSLLARKFREAQQYPSLLQPAPAIHDDEDGNSEEPGIFNFYGQQDQSGDADERITVATIRLRAR